MKTASTRLFSLDVFRGLTIALMITVNIPGSWSFIYPPFEHAEWHGCTPTDLVFPFFLFIVGTSIAFSFSKFNYTLTSFSLYKITERTFLIFTVGFMLNNFPFFNYQLSGSSPFEYIYLIIFRFILGLLPFLGIIWIVKKIFSSAENFILNKTDAILKALLFLSLIGLVLFVLFFLPVALYQLEYYNKDYSHIRIMGVLQRIALAYGLGALIIVSVRKKYMPYIIVSILFLYWFVLWYFGGSDPYSVEGNIGRQLDIWILGESHLWMGKGIPFDPEGILSTFPSVATVLSGFLVGKFIIDNKRLNNGWIYKLLLAGAYLIVIGLIWDLVFPINKPLWTSSYVLYTAGLAVFVFSFLYYVIDISGHKKPFIFFNVFGVNPLFAFTLHVLWVKLIAGILKWDLPDDTTVNAYGWIYNNMFQSWAGDYLGSLLFAVSHIIFFYIILLILYKKKIFIKI